MVRSPLSLMVPRHNVLWWALCALSLCAPCARASPGDRDDRFRACVTSCTNNDESVKSTMCSTESSASAPLTLLLTRWTCVSDCAYLCMHNLEKTRKLNGDQQVEGVWKYYGKWPFRRTLGCQEPLSVVFSIANAVPAAAFLLRRRNANVHAAAYPYAQAWDVHAALSLHSWIWSAIFHTRDTVFTERGDYLAAGAVIVYTTALAVVRVFDLRRPDRRVLVFAVAALVFATHATYMLCVHFDYGWNMQVLVTLGMTSALLWVTWSYRGGVFGIAMPPTPKHRDARRLLYVVLALQASSALELLDFPPIAGTSLDAHACWHLVTAIAAWPWFAWAANDHVVYADALTRFTR